MLCIRKYAWHKLTICQRKAVTISLPRLNHCSYGRSSTRFFSEIASIFKKVLHLKDLNCHLECTDVSFNPENGAFSKIKKWQTDRHSDYCNPLAHARWGLTTLSFNYRCRDVLTCFMMYISFFHLLVYSFCVTSFRTLSQLVYSFCVTSFRTFFADHLPSIYWWAVSVGGEILK